MEILLIVRVSVDESRCHGKLFDITIVVLICCTGDPASSLLDIRVLPSILKLIDCFESGGMVL